MRYINQLRLVILFLLVFMSKQVFAGTEAHDTQKKVTKEIEVRQATQKKEDMWDKDKSKLISKYRLLQSQKESLEPVKSKIQENLKIQKESISIAKRKIKESVRIRDELQLYLESAVAQLEELIKRDIPFLLKERVNRIESLKKVLARSDKSAAEKYRRVMEALKIEAEYGQSAEVYQDTINIDGQNILSDILRVGRLSLFYQTPDGKVKGYYDRVTGTWLPVKFKYHRDIDKAIKIARRERTIELVSLPIGRIVVP